MTDATVMLSIDKYHKTATAVCYGVSDKHDLSFRTLQSSEIVAQSTVTFICLEPENKKLLEVGKYLEGFDLP